MTDLPNRLRDLAGEEGLLTVDQEELILDAADALDWKPMEYLAAKARGELDWCKK